MHTIWFVTLAIESGIALTRFKRLNILILLLPGLHLEIDPRRGEISIYEKEGGRSPVYMCISTCTYTRGSGHAPPGNFSF